MSGIVTTMENDTQLGVDGAQITIYQDDMEITSTFSDAEGYYSVIGLNEGVYDVVITKSGYISQTIEDIAVNAANLTTQNFELVADQ